MDAVFPYIQRIKQLELLLAEGNISNNEDISLQGNICNYCKKPFGTLESYKVSNGKNYHTECFEQTIGKLIYTYIYFLKRT